jgi:hypothetical protein
VSNPYGIYHAKASTSKGASSGAHHGAFGFLENLGSDIYHAGKGLPAGLVMTAEHPIRSAEMMGKSTYHDWSPLFHGHFGEFARQTFAHPLAPILDVATVLSLGAGAAALAGKTGVALGADEGSLLGKLNTLNHSVTPDIRDVKNMGKEGVSPRPSLPGRTFGNTPVAKLHYELGRRLLSGLESTGHMPAFMKASAREARTYEHLHLADQAHRAVATAYIGTRQAMRAHQLLTDPVESGLVHRGLLKFNYRNLITHGHQWDPHVRDAAGNIVTDAHGARVYKPLPEGYTPVVAEHAASVKDFAPGEGGLAGDLKNFGQRFAPMHRGPLTDAAIKQFHREPGSGDLTLVHSGSVARTFEDASKTVAMLKKLGPNATTWWKRIQVGYSPRVVANVGFGNWLMYAMKHGGIGGAMGIVDALKQGGKAKLAERAFNDMHSHILQHEGPVAAAKFFQFGHDRGVANAAMKDRATGAHPYFAPAWQSKFFSHEITDNHLGAGLGGEGDSKLKAVLKSGFYPLVHKVGDMPVRQATLNVVMRKAPEVKAVMKANPGMRLDDAIYQALKENKNNLRARGQNAVRSIAGDYTTHTPLTSFLSAAMPFYNWDKHVVRHVGSMLTDRPGVSTAAVQAGQMGHDQTAKMLGNLPSFMEGALPLSLLGLRGNAGNGRTSILTTSGLNPYSTVSDLTNAALAATTGGSAGAAGAALEGAGNPIVANLINSIVGANPETGAPVPKHGGPISSALVNTAEGFTPAQTLMRLAGLIPQHPKTPAGAGAFGGGRTPKPFLYNKDAMASILASLGVPVKKANLARAHQMADKERGVKSSGAAFGGGRKHKGAF